MNLTESVRHEFTSTLRQYYIEHGRHDLPWRLPDDTGAFDPYKILVSELMLQQTQVKRVIPKYEAFLERFPSVGPLAKAPLSDVLIVWQGLGYNRRAKYLWQTAQMVRDDFGGHFPSEIGELVRLPGVGRNTAGAVAAYAFNLPELFIETNVRTVYIHHFFGEQSGIDDKSIIEFLDKTLDRQHPREFYWALMDYGSHLKLTAGNAASRSRHHVRQSPFQGSRRQVRGAVIRELGVRGRSLDTLQAVIPDSRLLAVLTDLLAEGMVAQTQDMYHLA